MGVGKRFGSISVQVLLLIALAIQGLVPDLYTLASRRGLYVLCQIPLPLDASERHADQNEDSVCGPIRHSGIVESLESLEALERLPRSCARSKIGPNTLGTRREILDQDDYRLGAPRVITFASHCRLTC